MTNATYKTDKIAEAATSAARRRFSDKDLSEIDESGITPTEDDIDFFADHGGRRFEVDASDIPTATILRFTRIYRETAHNLIDNKKSVEWFSEKLNG
jgi:hypothetical protein